MSLIMGKTEIDKARDLLKDMNTYVKTMNEEIQNIGTFMSSAEALRFAESTEKGRKVQDYFQKLGKNFGLATNEINNVITATTKYVEDQNTTNNG